ncbi:MAG: DUF262 domain-containing protein [Paludibacteraceae bacterium]|nr:DUF262 domain-containing protein [Paludibacteraceae bacterium]
MNTIQANITPAYIASQRNQFFQIPLYQRLFEWEDEQIEQLMSDLHKSLLGDPNQPYYIGMLTCKQNGKYLDLVDGQQRFTMMMLFGLHFGWSEFLRGIDGQPRLHFCAREADNNYIEDKINHTPSVRTPNQKMEHAIECIERYIEKNNIDRQAFADYTYRNLTFFISELPGEYDAADLNLYFERMNTTGKALESHEILKVEILRMLSDHKEEYSNIWNAVSQTDKMLIRSKTEQNQRESTDSLRRRYQTAILDVIDGKLFTENYIKADKEEDDEPDELTAIGDIKASDENPYRIIQRRTDEHSMLTFTEFLLQVLYVSLGKDPHGLNTTDFFDVHQLTNTFYHSLPYIKVEQFMRNLLLCRLLTDYFMVRLDDDAEEPYPFELYTAEEEPKRRVKQYQCLLYAASTAVTYYFWLPDLLAFLGSKVKESRTLDIDADEFLRVLKKIDNSWHPKTLLEGDNLTYRKIDRYWFWRIDYYLWENRSAYFTNKASRELADNYVFRRNRSIEHIAPQHPRSDSSFKWENDGKSEEEDAMLRDSLGNMVMISSGQNSSLSNEPFEIKKARAEAFLKGEISGRIESLNMLYVHKCSDWNRTMIRQHNDFIMNLLYESYNQHN